MIALDTRAGTIDINHFWRGRPLIGGDQFDEAIEDYTAAIGIDPS
jgi:hypothetical protein